MKDLDFITGQIVDAAYKLHRRLGPGLFETVYEELLERELIARGFFVERQKLIPLVIDGIKFDRGFRADLVVDRRVLIELKSMDRLPAVCGKQVLTYLKLLDLRVGLLINFGVSVLGTGIQRFVNGFDASPNSPLLCNRPR